MNCFSAHAVAEIAAAIAAANPGTALAEVQERLAADSALQIADDYIASEAETENVRYHELGHFLVGLKEGWVCREFVVRRNGTGRCIFEIPDARYTTSLKKITLILGGAAADLRSRPFLGGRANCDIIAARLAIDSLNARQDGPPVSYEEAARTAVTFIDAHWQKIRTVAIELRDSGELSQDTIAMLLRCDP